MMASADIRPFTIDIPQPDLDDLRARLDRTRWAVPAGEEYGFGVSWLRRLVEYWRRGYDWRRWEARLNSYLQFVTEIGGERSISCTCAPPSPVHCLWWSRTAGRARSSSTST
jgi:epoxide hydrolase